MVEFFGQEIFIEGIKFVNVTNITTSMRIMSYNEATEYICEGKIVSTNYEEREEK